MYKRAAFAGFCFLFAAPLFAQQSQPPSPGPSKPAQEQQQHRSREENKSQAGTDARLGPKENDAGNNRHTPSAPDWWVAGFTAVLAAAAVIQVLIYKQQTELMAKALGETTKAANAARDNAESTKQQVALMDSQKTAIMQTAEAAIQQAGLMREGIELTRLSADAAKDSAVIAKQTLEISQRAYVGVVSITLKHQHPKTANQGSFLSSRAIEVTCKNSGNTRAVKFFFRLEIAVDGVDRMILKPTDWETTPTSLNPGETSAPIVSRTLAELFPLASDAMLSSVFSDRKLRVHGEIHYRDVFGFGFTIHCVATLGAEIDSFANRFDVTTNLSSDVQA